MKRGALLATSAFAQDAVQTDGDKCKVIAQPRLAERRAASGARLKPDVGLSRVWNHQMVI